EDRAVAGEVALVCGEAIGAIQYGEEVGQQVDQHRPERGEVGATGSFGGGMIVARPKVNKSRRRCRCMAQFFPSHASEGGTKGGRAPMTTLQQIESQCPICETHFRSQSVVSTNSFGGKRTDFHERCGSVAGVEGAGLERAGALYRVRDAVGIREV